MARAGGNPQNLRPWPKGVSGNPGGRPRYQELTQALRKLLAQKLGPKHDLWPELADAQRERYKGRTPAEVIALVTLLQAVNGNNVARELIWNRIEGRVPMPVQGDPKAPITVDHHHHVLSAEAEALLRTLLAPKSEPA